MFPVRQWMILIVGLPLAGGYYRINVVPVGWCCLNNEDIAKLWN